MTKFCKMVLFGLVNIYGLSVIVLFNLFVIVWLDVSVPSCIRLQITLFGLIWFFLLFWIFLWISLGFRYLTLFGLHWVWFLSMVCIIHKYAINMILKNAVNIHWSFFPSLVIGWFGVLWLFGLVWCIFDVLVWFGLSLMFWFGLVYLWLFGLVYLWLFCLVWCICDCLVWSGVSVIVWYGVSVIVGLV